MFSILFVMDEFIRYLWLVNSTYNGFFEDKLLCGGSGN